MFAGSFFIDQTAQKLYLWLSDGSNPSSKTVEADNTSGPLLTTNNQSYIHLQGLQFQHCANLPQGNAAVRLSGGSNCTASNCNVQWVAGAGFEVGGSNQTVTNGIFNNNGQLGLHASSATNCLVQGCETSNNNNLAGKQFDTGWEAGGNKFALTRSFTVDHHLSHDNHGSGIWFDVDNEGATITNCTCYRNMQGIHYEISYNGLIANNVCYSNNLQGADINSPTGQGIYVSSSAGCQVYNNTCWGNDTRGINISGPLRGDGNGGNVYSYATIAYNNICAQNQAANTNAKDYSLDVSTTADPNLNNTVVPFSPNVSDYNLFYRNDTHNFFSASGTVYQTLGGYQSGTGQDPHSLWGDPLFKSSAGADFHITYLSPGIDTGTTISQVTVDHDGVTRAQGVGYDIGAYEKSVLFFQTESLTAVQTSGDTHRIFSEAGLSGGSGTILDANAINDYVIYNVPNVAAGTYDVRIGVKEFNTRGTWQLSIGRADNFSGSASNVGTPQDEYSASAVYTEYDLGTWTPASTSDKWFKFLVTAKNAASSGYSIAFDYIELVPAN